MRMTWRGNKTNEQESPVQRQNSYIQVRGEHRLVYSLTVEPMFSQCLFLLSRRGRVSFAFLEAILRSTNASAERVERTKIFNVHVHIFVFDLNVRHAN